MGGVWGGREALVGHPVGMGQADRRMAGRVAGLCQGVRKTDTLRLGVVAKTFPVERVNAVGEATGQQSQRRRDWPAHPTAEWAAQQMIEAFLWDTAPRILVRDRSR